jgi:hypothetical protein
MHNLPLITFLWTTRDGNWFEEVEAWQMDRNDVIIRHKYGVARLSISTLSNESRSQLYRGSRVIDRPEMAELREAA